MSSHSDIFRSKKTTPVILCGGIGKRLWPISSERCPKQFLSIVRSDETLFQSTLKRVYRYQYSAPIIVGSRAHERLIQDQTNAIEHFASGKILLEPSGRNTAAALTVAVLQATADSSDPILLVTPADHHISDMNAFHMAIELGISGAERGAISIFGVKPDRPETGYGYFQCVDGSDVPGLQTVVRFFEKPGLEDATRYLNEGNYFWNSGIFILRASVWLKTLGQFRPEILAKCKDAWQSRVENGAFVNFNPQTYGAIPSESIDSAVIERIPMTGGLLLSSELEVGWTDLGAWDAVHRASERDESGNSSKGDVTVFGCSDSFFQSLSKPIVSIGVSNLIVCDTREALLVANKSQLGHLSEVVDALRGKAESSSGVDGESRPWGHFEVFLSTANYKVKRIIVRCGHSISLQKHNFRKEFWVVVRGECSVVKGEKSFVLSAGDSVEIDVGELHRVTNIGVAILEIIEVQYGSYVGEDDIERLTDDYGRVS